MIKSPTKVEIHPQTAQLMENATAGGTEIYDHRTSSMVNGVANARYAIGQIQDTYHDKTINGLFIFPDEYTHLAGLPALQHIKG